MNPFIRKARADAAWHRVGLASSFPDLGSDADGARIAPRCKAFHVPRADGTCEPGPPEEADLDLPGDMKDQVLVFKYKGNFHAVDHVSFSWEWSVEAPLISLSHALTPRSLCLRAASSTLRTLASSSAPASRVPNTDGPLTSSLAVQTAATTSSRSGRFSSGSRRQLTRSPRPARWRFGSGESKEWADRPPRPASSTPAMLSDGQ